MFDNTTNKNMYLWQLSTHTHKYGQDYDVFLRNSDGTKGNQIYEGHYDYKLDFNQGFYDYTHPPIKNFEPLLEIPWKTGLIHEATYNNNGTKNVGWGLTTEDEMMLITIIYTEEEPTATSVKESLNPHKVNVFPNPASDKISITYNLNKPSTVSAEIYDLLGRNIKTITFHSKQNMGSQSLVINDLDTKNANAVVFLKLTINDEVYVHKILLTNL